MTSSTPPPKDVATRDAPSQDAEVAIPSGSGASKAKWFGRVSLEYRAAIKKTLIPQVILLVLTSLMLDFGQIARLCSIAAFAYWATVAMIMSRRPEMPTQSDLTVIRYGFWMFLVVTRVLMPIVWKLTGQV